MHAVKSVQTSGNTLNPFFFFFLLNACFVTTLQQHPANYWTTNTSVKALRMSVSKLIGGGRREKKEACEKEEPPVLHLDLNELGVRAEPALYLTTTC